MLTDVLARARRSIHPSHAVLAIVITLVAAACSGAHATPQAASVDPLSMSWLESELIAQQDGAVAGLDDLAAPAPAERRLDQAATAGASSRIDDALIVRTGNLELEVVDVAAVLTGARHEIQALGGYVAGSNEVDQGEQRFASVTYRVPVARFNEAIDALRGMSERVARESTQSQEVTATVVDLDARIANLRASEAALVEIMDRSGRIEDVLAVQMRLEDVRGQIERLEAQRTNLADQAALSTISVSWFTPVAAVTVAQQGWSLSTEVDAALAQTVAALQWLAGFGVWLGVVAVPLLGLPLLVVAALALWLRHRLRRDQPRDGGTPTAAVTPSE